MMDLGRASWPGVPSRPLVLVPVGSTEQHGPHLPFSTDSIIATAVAESAASHLNAVVAPVIAYGASGEHQSFAGTVSIGSEALQLMVVELVRSLATWAGGILFVNGHGGNVTSLARAVPRMIAETHPVAWVPCSVSGGDAHAGRTETSIMLHLDASQVSGETVEAGNTTPMAELLPALRAGGTRSVSPSGILGDPTGATAGEGAELLERMIATVVRRAGIWRPDPFGCLAEAATP